MDPYLMQLINERSDRQDESLDEIKKMLKEHIEKDEAYWKKIDVQEGQVSLLKWMFGGTVTTAIGSAMAWFITNTKG